MLYLISPWNFPRPSPHLLLLLPHFRPLALPLRQLLLHAIDPINQTYQKIHVIIFIFCHSCIMTGQ